MNEDREKTNNAYDGRMRQEALRSSSPLMLKIVQALDKLRPVTFPTATVFPGEKGINVRTYTITSMLNNTQQYKGNIIFLPSVRRVNLPSWGKSENFSMHIKLFT